ncbi:MAG: phage tail tape measure protein, partial [Clostridia bacterium]|nr:phage tail tape measure protein [Clostridia bacterium]
MELFKIFGRIACDYSDAQRNIEAVSGAADSAAESIGSLSDRADGAQENIENLGSEVDETRESTEQLGEETERTGERTENTNEGFSTWKATLANLASTVIQKAISKVAELAKEIVGLGKDFTATMSEVKAISGASDEDFQKLTNTAREFGSKTVFSATEAAEALKYMSLAGWDAEQSSAALGGVLDLAAASGMGLGEASDMVTDYLTAFGMEADKSAYFADMLAYAQANSNTTAAQLGEAFGNCAATLHAGGQDVETVTSLLEAMANGGLKGSEAGTALNATMRDITNAMSEVKDKTDLANLSQGEFVSSTGDLNDLLGKNYIQMGKTLIPVSDANGNFRDLTDILTDVSKATDGMGDAERAAAMSSTFTSYSIKGVNLVLNEGIDKVAEYEKNLRKADGSASDMASTMNDNLKGDLAGMNSAFEELKLKIYDGLEGPLRSAVRFITGKVAPALTVLVQNIDKIAPPILIAATAIGTFLLVLNAGAILTAFTNGLKAVKTAFMALNTTMLANPIAIVIAAIAALVAAFIYLWNNCEGFRNFWIKLGEKIKEVAGYAWEALQMLVN